MDVKTHLNVLNPKPASRNIWVKRSAYFIYIYALLIVFFLCLTLLETPTRQQETTNGCECVSHERETRWATSKNGGSDQWITKHGTDNEMKKWNDTFVPTNENYYLTVHDLCLEPELPSSSVTTFGDNGWQHTLNVTKNIITVYNSKQNLIKEFTTKPHAGYDIPWVIHFRKQPLPENFTYVSDYPAYFLLDGNLCNVWHFRRETLCPLYYVLKKTNRLNSTIPNMVYLHRPVYELTMAERNKGAPGGRDPTCFATTMLPVLSVRPDFDSYHKASKICYKNAVFGQEMYLANLMPDPEIHDYITRGLGVSNPECGGRPFIVLIGRKKRAIINMERLKDIAIRAGYTNTSIVYLEKIPLRDQIRTIECTDILVGVQGAALDWAAYMKGENSSILEVAWTAKNWLAYYSWLYNGYRGMRTYTIEASDVRINWDLYEADRKGNWKPKLTQREREQVLEREKHEIWKYGDVIVDEKEFEWKLEIIVRGLHLERNKTTK